MTQDPQDIPLQPIEVDCLDVESKLNGGANICLIDVRETWEYERDHLENAHHIPLGLMGMRLTDIQELAEKHDGLVMICEHGIRSLDASWYLKQEGVSAVSSMKGGMAEWRQTVNTRIVTDAG